MIKTLFNLLRGRHVDGSEHVWVETSLANHICDPMSYCHHSLYRCVRCPTERIKGYSVEEIR